MTDEAVAVIIAIGGFAILLIVTFYPRSRPNNKPGRSTCDLTASCLCPECVAAAKPLPTAIVRRRRRR